MQGSNHELNVLMRDAATGFYRMQRYRVGDFFGHVDLKTHVDFKHNARTIGTGLLAALFFSDPTGFYVSSIEEGPCFDNLDTNTPL